MTCKIPDFAQEDYYLNKKEDEANEKSELFKQAQTLCEDSNQTVTSIKIYRDIHSDAKYALVGFKGKAIRDSGVILVKRPSKLQMLIYRIKSLFRRKKDNNGTVEL